MPSCRWGCDKHIAQSNGGDSNLMKFYCTTNKTAYSQQFPKFQPRQGDHPGTGYVTNIRPQIFYSSHLDDIDNPSMNRILEDSYVTVTKKSYRGYGQPDGSDDLRTTVKQGETGYIRQKPLNVPIERDAYAHFLDKQVMSAPMKLRPKQVPVLHKGYPKDPTEMENCGYGPEYMSTETHSKFRVNPKDPYKGLDPTPKEDSGFTHNINDEPLTFYPGQPFDGRVPDYMTGRYTGVSIGKTSYLPLEFQKGDRLPKITDKANRDTGFIRSVDRLQRFPPRDPNDNKGVTALVHTPKPLQPGFDNNQVGNKLETGYTENEPRYVQTSDNPLRFVTHYQTRFLDRTPPDTENQGHVWGGVLPQKPDGFSRSTGVHSITTTDMPNYGETLRKLDPYVSRSIKARDEYYDDHKFDSKMHTCCTRMDTAA